MKILIMDLHKLGGSLQRLYCDKIYNCYVGISKYLLVSFIDDYYENRHFILLFKPNGDVVIEESLEKSINTLYAHYLITDDNPKPIDKEFDDVVRDIIDKIRQAYIQSHGITPNP